MDRTERTGEYSPVSLVRCHTYDFPAVHDAVKKAVIPLLSRKDMLKPGAKVLLKINLLSASKGPDRPVNTHPSVIRSLAKIFKEDFDCAVFVGDSTSSFSKGSTGKGFKNMGLDLLSSECGFGLFNVDREEAVVLKNPGNRIIREIAIPRRFSEFDFVVSVPKLKTHELVGYTGAVKNMLGCVPGKMKRDVHVKAPTSKMMADALCDVYNFVRPRFAVMDGIVGMQGAGPSAGEPYPAGLIAASPDPVSLDAVMMRVLGFSPREVLTVRRAHERGLGMGDLDLIRIIGEPLERCLCAGFKKPSNTGKLFLENLIPAAFLSRAIDTVVSFLPYIDAEKCVRCFECVKGCPANCIVDSGGKLIIDKKRCIECFCCQEVCPANAVMVKPPLVKLMLGKIQKFIEDISG